MPITQERMQSLILAARDYQQALQQACALVKSARQAAYTSSDAALAEIEKLAGIIFESGLLKQPLTSHSTILLEEQHFKKEASKNNYRKEKMRELRGGLRGNTAPNRVYTPKPVPGEALAAQLKEKYASMTAEEVINSSYSSVSPEVRAAIERQVELEARQDAWLAARSAKTEASPTPTNPSEPPKGLYDEDEDDEGPLLG